MASRPRVKIWQCLTAIGFCYVALVCFFTRLQVFEGWFVLYEYVGLEREALLMLAFLGTPSVLIVRFLAILY